MTNRSRSLFYGILGVAGGMAGFFGLGAAGARAAGTVTAIHSFSPLAPNGAAPYTPLIQGSDGNFYGTASSGGVYASGTVFQVTPAGALTTLYSFTAGNDGAFPRGGLALGTNGNFYGTTHYGGSNGDGAVFMITPGGSLTPLHSFASQTDGAYPLAGMTLATNGDFYGTTSEGGLHDYGAVYQITAAGAFANIYSFKDGTDGGGPLAPLALGPDGQLYGTTSAGGNGLGAIFKITTGGVLTPLYAFTDGSDGESPYGGLALGVDGNFYGAAIHGTTGYGVIFQITPMGQFSPLFDLPGGDQGAGPFCTLIQGADTNFYGTTFAGGSNGAGAIFQYTAGGVFTSFYSFTNGSDGSSPFAGLIQGTNGVLYGTAEAGGDGSGTVFEITTNGVFTPLCSLPGGGGDGATPRGALLQDTNGLLYGASFNGGTNGDGAIFEITTNGVLTPLYSFTGLADGANPWGSLMLGTDGNLYGTTGNFSGPLSKSPSPYGTVFKMTTGGALTTLYSFKDGSDGAAPHAGVMQGLDGNFYGTTLEGGSGYGALFKLTNGGGFAPLHSFNGGSDGASPWAALVQATDTNFYGTASGGGSANGYGTIFKLTPKGAFSVVREFAGGNGSSPYAPMIQGTDGNLYGTTYNGGSAGFGTVFALTLPNTLASLYSFTNGIDGANPEAALVQGDDNNLYGTTFAGGANGTGVVFKITTGGVFQPLYSFSAADKFGFNQDGAGPFAGLIRAGDGNFYGTTEGGGQNGTGTIFRLVLAPPAPPQFLSATETGVTLTFTWSAEPGYDYQLQFCTNLAQGNWSNLGGARPATNSFLNGSDSAPPDAQRFYRVILQQ